MTDSAADNDAIVVDDSLLTPLFHDDQTTSSSSNSSESPRRQDEWSSYFSSANPAPTFPPKSTLISMDDFASLFQQNSATAHAPHHPWAMVDLDQSMADLIADDSQYAIDPSTLQCTYPDQSNPSIQPQDLFQFTVTQPLDEVSQLPTPAPASTTSFSSDSRDNSPEPLFSSSSPASINPSELDLYAQRARQATGILMAVRAPVNGATPSTLNVAPSLNTNVHQQPITPVSPILNDSQIPNATKLPIPRLRPTSASSPNPTLFQQPLSNIKPDPFPSPSPHTIQPQPQLLTKNGRPKTSHTTIERRYRTNLNARILALKRAVPALRILEKANGAMANSGKGGGGGGATQGKGMTGACVSKWDFNDIVNERGYVDGVKAAKKNSKGVVLGKAVEYIKALKRRETRLKHEADGLRALIGSLVGGAELLQEWETDWRARFGGEEMDEVEEGEGAVGDDECDEAGADDGEEEEEEEEEEEGRSKKRKRGENVSSGGAAAKGGVAAPAEKRKRGRPRKNPQSSVSASTQLHEEKLVLQPQAQVPAQAQAQTGQSTYYLAGVLLFNFLWSTSPSSTATSRTHEGTVLTAHHATPSASSSSFSFFGLQIPPTSTWGTREMVNFVALLVVLVPLVKAYVGFVLPVFWKFGRRGEGEAREVKLKKVFESVTEGEGADEDEGEVERLLEVGSVWKVGKVVIRRVVRGSASVVAAGSPSPLTNKPENDVQVQLWAWRQVTEGFILNPETTSFFARIHTYLRLSSLLQSFPGSLTTNDCIILSLLIKPFSLSSAVVWWSRAENLTKHGLDSFVGEEVLESIVLGVGLDRAAEMAGSVRSNEERRLRRQGGAVVRLIASAVLQDWLGDLAKRGFVDVVNHSAAAGTGATAGNATNGGPSLSSLVVGESDMQFVRGVRVLAATASSDSARKEAGWGDAMRLLEGILRGCVASTNPDPSDFRDLDLDLDLGVDLGWSWGSASSTSVSDDASSTSEDENALGLGLASSSLLERVKGRREVTHMQLPSRTTKIFLLATLLYLRITSSFSSSPHGVPTSYPATEELENLKLTLRRALASEAFDVEDGVEEARDRVVDLLDERRGGGESRNR